MTATAPKAPTAPGVRAWLECRLSTITCPQPTAVLAEFEGRMGCAAATPLEEGTAP